MELLPVFAAYLALCGLVAYEAVRQGRFGAGILISSLAFSPLVTLWYLVITSDSRDYEKETPPAAPLASGLRSGPRAWRSANGSAMRSPERR